MLGDGSGSFTTPAATFAVGSNPGEVVVGDFNKDGIQDLATANSGSDDVSILIGIGTGSFIPAATTYAVGDGPSGVSVGDFNMDGNQDLATANLDSDNVSILSNRTIIPAMGGIVSFLNADFIVTEGGTATISVVRTGVFDGELSVEYVNNSLTAAINRDFEDARGRITFANGEGGMKTFTIRTFEDSVVEGDERLTVTLHNPNGGDIGLGQAVLTIRDNDSGSNEAMLMQFSDSNYNVGEGEGFATVTVVRTGDLSSEARVSYIVSEGTATVGSDFDERLDTLIMPAGVASVTIKVRIFNDTVKEEDEVIQMQLLDVQGGAKLGARSRATITIKDND